MADFGMAGFVFELDDYESDTPDRRPGKSGQGI